MIIKVINSYVDTDEIAAVTPHKFNSGHYHYTCDWYSFEIILKGSKEKISFLSENNMESEYNNLIKKWIESKEVQPI